MKPQATNPWGCTELEVLVLDAFVRTGNLQAVAMELRRGEKAVQATILRCRTRMGVDNRVLLALKWAEWQQQVAKACGVQDRLAEPCTRCHGLGFTVRRRA